MIICRKNSSDPSTREVRAYKRVSIEFTDQLACGILLRDNVVYNPADMNKNGSYESVFVASIWNDLTKISPANNKESFGELRIDTSGFSNWRTLDKDHLKAYGPTQITPNMGCIVTLCPAADFPQSYAYDLHYNVFKSSSAIHPTLESGGILRVPNTEYGYGFYNENSLSKDLTCLALSVDRIGSGISVLFRVSYMLNVRIKGDKTYKPSNDNFDMTLCSLWNTMGSNNVDWSANVISSLENNRVGYRSLQGATVPNGVDSEGNPIMLFASERSWIYPTDQGWNPLRLALPSLHLGPYSTIPGAAPSKTIQITGYAMTVEGALISSE